MLVLTRKVGDIIAIGDNIKVIVMSIKGKQVRLGIEADKSTVVHREEIYQRIKQENSLAAQSSTDGTSLALEMLKNKAFMQIDETEKNSKSVFIRKKKTED